MSLAHIHEKMLLLIWLTKIIHSIYLRKFCISKSNIYIVLLMDDLFSYLKVKYLILINSVILLFGAMPNTVIVKEN